MPDIWMDVDTALAEVPVNIMPLIDATDFKTIEDAVAYNAAGMALRWHFVTTAGAYTVTSVTPTTGGSYDWTDQGDSGIYTIEIPASGGASINNDTEGFGWFTGKADGVLPWRGPIIGFRAAGLNNLLIDDAHSATRGLAGTALPNAAADGAGGLPISDAGGLDLDAKIGALTFGTANRVNAQVYGMEANVLTAAATASDFGTEIGTAVLTALGTGTWATAIPWNASWDAEVQSEVQDAIEANNLDHLVKIAVDTDFATTVHANSVIGHMADNGSGFDRTTDSLETIRDAMATAANLSLVAINVNSVLTDTNELQTDWADGGRLDLILDARASQASVDAIDDLLDTEVAAIKSDTAAILVDTNELQTDWTDGGRLDAILDAIAADNPNRPARGVEFANLPFLMVDATDFATPETGITVTATISKDGGSFASCTNSVSEIGSGVYKITLTSTEMTADRIVLKFTGTGCAQRTVVIITQPT